jgi:hypothetical protein
VVASWPASKPVDGDRFERGARSVQVHAGARGRDRRAAMPIRSDADCPPAAVPAARLAPRSAQDSGRRLDGMPDQPFRVLRLMENQSPDELKAAIEDALVLV